MSLFLLNSLQYVHILNNDTAEVRLERGPQRIILKGNETCKKIHDVTVVTEQQYAVVRNPYDATNKRYLMGEREVRLGPCVIALHANEMLESVYPVHVLRRNEALRLVAIRDHDDKVAGQVWQIEGPCKFVPNKYTEVRKKISAILVNENEGLYVQNVDTSEKKLVLGPCSYLLAANEEVYKKQYSELEKKSLGLPSAPSEWATVIHLKRNETVCILDNEKNERIVQGLGSVILGPEEFVKCMSLSAGKPKIPKQVHTAKIYLGPDFTSDKFEVRTKDNAQLRLLLTYKWEFFVSEDDAWKVFSSDFIGYACSSLCSRIREATAGYTFEEFHGNTVSIMRRVLFQDNKIVVSGEERTMHGLWFDEINLLISEVDVKEITPVNEEINRLLNESIKTNMRVVCSRMENEAKRESEIKKIQARSEIAKLTENLIDIQNENMDLDQVTKAKIDGQALLQTAMAQKEAEELKVRAKMALETEHMKSLIALLSTENGAKYLQLSKAENLAQTKKTIFMASDDKVQVAL